MKMKYNLLLLLAAAIWGFAFVAQRVGMDYIGPFTFNGVRFALGALSLLPLVLFYKEDARPLGSGNIKAWQAGIAAGVILFVAASLQQIGLLYTTAGKAAFITCLYIVLVPIIGIFLQQRMSGTGWLGSVLALTGLYFLCVKENFTIAYGDLFELAGAFFWSFHILVIDRFSRKVDALQLALFQTITCSVLSLVTAAIWETITLSQIFAAGIPLLYGGICSVGIAYTLQIIGQKKAAPAPAAIILSMETVFAALGGYLILGEMLGPEEIGGCILMMTGMLLSQLRSLKPQNQKATVN